MEHSQQGIESTPFESNSNIETTNENLEECLRLLQSGVDEQRLVGLLLSTKFVSGEDLTAVKRIFHAIGFDFIDRLLKTAETDFEAVSFPTSSDKAAQKLAFASLALSILSAFCRVPELASCDEMLAKVPQFLEIIKCRKDGSPMQEAYECLLGIASGSESGFRMVKDEEPLGIVATDIQLSPSDATWLPTAIGFLKFMFSRGVEDSQLYEHKKAFACMVPSLSRELASRSDDVKFDALSLLVSVLAPEEDAEPVRCQLRESQPGNEWTTGVRLGLGHILHSRIGEEQRQACLRLARVALEFCGDSWLTGPITSPADSSPLPSARFFLLVLETLRVEVPLQLDTLARLTFVKKKKKKKSSGKEAEEEQQQPKGGLSRGLSANLGMGGGAFGGGGSSLSRGKSMNVSAMMMDFDSNSNTSSPHDPFGTALLSEPLADEVVPVEVLSAQRVVGECFAVLETVIEVAARLAEQQEEEEDEEEGRRGGDAERKQNEAEGVHPGFAAAMSPSVMDKVVEAMDETVGVVLEFLEQAKAFDRRVDNGVLACVRVVGRFLAEAPAAHREQVLPLLSFMMGVRSMDEELPVKSVRFLLPVLLQVTCLPKGCRAIVRRGGHKHVVRFFQEQSRTNVMGSLKAGREGEVGLAMACDVLLNILGTREEAGKELDPQDFAPVFAAIVAWTSALDSKKQPEAVVSLAMAACLGASILELTSEEIIKSKLDLAAYKRLPKAMDVIVKFLEFRSKMNSEFTEADVKDLWDITISSCIEAFPKWPLLKRSMEKSDWWIKMTRRPLTKERLLHLVKESQLRQFLSMVGGL